MGQFLPIFVEDAIAAAVFRRTEIKATTKMQVTFFALIAGKVTSVLIVFRC
jgi:hypothetical protein